jgi:cytochrome c biogenesis protein
VIGISIFKHVFNGLASVAFAIPLLVLIAVATILGGLIPQGDNVDLISSAPEWVREFNVYLQFNDIFHSWWYVLLLVLLCISLLAVTIKRVPTVWRQRGLGVATGILLAHVGIILIIGGAIYGGLSGFRYYVRVVEGEVAIVPTLPFVIKLDRFTMEYYPRDAYGNADTGRRIPKRQESELTLYRSGEAFMQTTTAPGKPVTVDGITLLADDNDIGWAFSLVVVDPANREKVIEALPWMPPLVRLGLSETRIFAHEVTRVGIDQGDAEAVVKPNAAEVYLLEADGNRESLGFASEEEPLTIYNHTVFPWNIRPYTGLNIYRRSGMTLLVVGLVCLVAGLLINLYVGRRTLGSTQENIEH